WIGKRVTILLPIFFYHKLAQSLLSMGFGLVVTPPVCFEKFLELFAAAYPDDLHIIQLDNGGFHNSLNLNISENVILLFQPAYSPEVNPIERLWGYIKEQLKWLRFDGIEELRETLQKELKKLTNEVIASLTGYPFRLESLSVAGV
ncbi:transposase, partial [Microcoleus sp. AR_TQ3_B6]|uniref:transposase n=1 Tax=Microcoleus sp. AR_TQ3_B6 TaxID=3055284 RepID=UPI002FD55980